MTSTERLSRVGSRLVRRYKTRDPFEICKQLGITVLYCDNLGSLKGMYRVSKRNRFIFLNSTLDRPMRRIVCAHELGHDQLHRYLSGNGTLQEFMLFNESSVFEREANIVAAEILLDSNEVLGYIYHRGYTNDQIAAATETDVNLVALKVRYLIERGYGLKEMEHNSKFLK